MTDCSVLVLAGGRSRRFGRDKLHLDWHGQALLDHVVRRMLELSDDVILLAAHGAAQPDQAPGVRLLADRAPSPGPLHAVADGLAHARHATILVVAADMPLVPMRILDLLLAELGTDQRAVVGLLVHGRIEPLPIALFRDTVTYGLNEALRGGGTRLGALRDLPGAYGIPEDTWRSMDERGDSLRDIDTEEDLRLLLAEPSED